MWGWWGTWYEVVTKQLKEIGSKKTWLEESFMEGIGPHSAIEPVDIIIIIIIINIIIISRNGLFKQVS